LEPGTTVICPFVISLAVCELPIGVPHDYSKTTVSGLEAAFRHEDSAFKKNPPGRLLETAQ
jgi:hypothetical protein